MAKITFIGAGSTIFAKNVLGDSILSEALEESEIALFDIDLKRLKESDMMLNNIVTKYNKKTKIVSYEDRKKALANANYVINAIQVGGYDPCTITDFEIPKKYSLKQTIADTIGIGGIFRGLRTIPVVIDILKDMEEVCPNALFINYTNPMAIITGAMRRASGINSIGLCHSVQECMPKLIEDLELNDHKIQAKIAGINHMAWLLEVTSDGKDIYPLIKERAFARNAPHDDMVRYEIMKQFGYYVTESSEHNSEYLPYFIKSKYPELIEKFNIPIDEYIRRCIKQSEDWDKMRDSIVNNNDIEHERTPEYASFIMEAMETNIPYKFAGNVPNTGLITNLPSDAIVEVPCLVDRSGISPCYVGRLPEQCAALNRTNINVQLLTIEAAMTLKKENIYYAAMLDPHTSSELSIDDIKKLCDELIEAHGDWLPKFN